MNWCMNCFCMKCTYSNLFFCMPAGCWNSNRLCSDFARPPNLAEGGVCNFNYCMIRGLGLSVLFLTGGGANVGGCEWRHGRGGGACVFFWIAWLNSDFLTRSHWFMMKWLSRERSAPWFFFSCSCWIASWCDLPFVFLWAGPIRRTSRWTHWRQWVRWQWV